MYIEFSSCCRNYDLFVTTLAFLFPKIRTKSESKANKWCRKCNDVAGWGKRTPTRIFEFRVNHLARTQTSRYSIIIGIDPACSKNYNTKLESPRLVLFVRGTHKGEAKRNYQLKTKTHRETTPWVCFVEQSIPWPLQYNWSRSYTKPYFITITPTKIEYG